MHVYHMENTSLLNVRNYSVNKNVKFLHVKDACVPHGYIRSYVMYTIIQSITMLGNCYSQRIHVYEMKNTTLHKVRNYSVNENAYHMENTTRRNV